MRKAINLAFGLVLAVLVLGCRVTASTPPLAPGAVNQFDQTSYQTLLAVQAAYNSLAISYNANKTGLAALKAPLDQVATDYNLAEIAWQTYHAAATASNQAALTTALTKVQTDISAIKVAP